MNTQQLKKDIERMKKALGGIDAQVRDARDALYYIEDSILQHEENEIFLNNVTQSFVLNSKFDNLNPSKLKVVK